MPHVRALAGPPRHRPGGPLGPALEADTTASLLGLLEASGAASDHATRAALCALVERFEGPCSGLVSRVAAAADAPAEARRRLGLAGMARLLQAARVGPTVEVSLAELALLARLRRWATRRMSEAELERYGELVDALAEDELEARDAIDLSAALAPPAPAPEAPAEPAPPPAPEPPVDPEAPTDPAPPPAPAPAPT